MDEQANNDAEEVGGHEMNTEAEFARLSAEVSSMKTQQRKMEPAIVGNGRDGLLTDVASMKSSIDSLQASQAEEARKVRKVLAIVSGIMSAILGIGFGAQHIGVDDDFEMRQQYIEAREADREERKAEIDRIIRRIEGSTDAGG